MKTCSTLLINKENSDVKWFFLSVQLAKFKRKVNIHCHGVALEIVTPIKKKNLEKRIKSFKMGRLFDSEIILIKCTKI